MLERARPQSLLLTFFAVHVLGTGCAIATGSVLRVMSGIGVGEHAARSTLARMVERGLLVRQPRGRAVYLSLTPRAADVLADGRRRMWDLGPVVRDWDGHWTVVAFTVPEARRAERHDLRSRLVWAGFGKLNSGIWIAIGHPDVEQVVGGQSGVTVLSAAALAPTRTVDLVASAFDTAAIGARYEAFLDRWDPHHPQARSDPLSSQLLLHTDWLQLIRADPRLPVEQLPRDWPAIRAERLARRLDAGLDPQARQVAASMLDLVPANDPTTGL